MVDIATGAANDREPTSEEQGKDPAAVARGHLGGTKGVKLGLKRCPKNGGQKFLVRRRKPAGNRWLAILLKP
jgi:hypothetical protein